MNSNIKTGGPAFPTDNAHQTGPHSYHAEGMTLRDWFAGMAMQGFLATQIHGFTDSPAKGPFANMAYEMADAMLNQREAK